nr:hypothetical protein [Tanacetum cinerariifolium]
MQEELLQFKMKKIWVLVDLPKGKRAIGSKWVFRNKKDKRGIVIRNKARLIAHGHTQEEGIDYDEVFDPVARIEAIILFLAYASFMRFNENGFQRGKFDQTLFIKKQKGDILLVQVYVDDIIFGSANKELCKAFKKLMKDKFQMSSIEELTFFLGLQVKQKDDGIFISQDKYVAEILRKFCFTNVKSASTPIETEKPLLKDPDGEDVDVHMYRSMIGSLMYLTSSRPDIIFAVCACVHFQVTPKVSHLHAVKRIFRYLKSKLHLGLWYPKDYPFNLVAYSDSDYAGASLDRKSTTGGCQFLEKPKKVYQALKDPSWIEAMQEELLQFKLQKVWVLVDLPKGKRAIGSKWGFRNKKDEKRILIRNKARLIVHGHTQEEGIDYDEVFAPVARIEAIRLQVKQKDDGIFISQDKYVAKILRKFGFTDVKSTSTPIETEKPLLKDPDVKRIFRYLKGKPHLGLWYPRDSPFNLVAYSDSDYARASLDKKSTTGGCQFFGCRLISWQCKKQTVVAISSTKAEYVAAASC